MLVDGSNSRLVRSRWFHSVSSTCKSGKIKRLGRFMLLLRFVEAPINRFYVRFIEFIIPFCIDTMFYCKNRCVYQMLHLIVVKKLQLQNFLLFFIKTLGLDRSRIILV